MIIIIITVLITLVLVLDIKNSYVHIFIYVYLKNNSDNRLTNKVKKNCSLGHNRQLRKRLFEQESF